MHYYYMLLLVLAELQNGCSCSLRLLAVATNDSGGRVLGRVDY